MEARGGGLRNYISSTWNADFGGPVFVRGVGWRSHGAIAGQQRTERGQARRMTGIVSSALRADYSGIRSFTFSDGEWSGQTGFVSTKDLLRAAGMKMAMDYYGGDGRMSEGYVPSNYQQSQLNGQVVGMLPLSTELGNFEYKTTTYELPEAIGMHVKATYLPSQQQRSVYSKFNFVVTVSANVLFHDGAMGQQGAYTNIYPLNGRPTFYGEEESREVLGYNALTNPTSNAWYNVFVSVVGYANEQWNVIGSFNFGWSNTSGRMEFNLPSNGYIPIWHFESIYDQTKW